MPHNGGGQGRVAVSEKRLSLTPNGGRFRDALHSPPKQQGCVAQVIWCPEHPW
jgi:hypothetical protein